MESQTLEIKFLIVPLNHLSMKFPPTKIAAGLGTNGSLNLIGKQKNFSFRRKS
ncbi:MAG: hypothetical protein Q4D17_03400 [Planctomycetia bacterium]|nr:hypothetical protein [Planctomycetia bacterium]